MNQSLSPAPQRSVPQLGDSSIGGLLVASGKITAENAESALRMQRELGIRFGEAAKRMGLITEADIEQVLACQFDYPYLRKGESNYPDTLKAAYEPFSPQVEMLRAVRSQLMLRWFALGHRSLTIMGAGAGDGTSLLAANLAVVFSQLGERTLLVDANMRAPSQHQTFSLEARQGLSDVLAGRADFEVISKIDAFVALSVLNAGTLPPNPQELLSRSSFAAVNLELESLFDVVLYDAPAISTGSDGLAIAARTKGVLLVIRKNKTGLAEVQALQEQIKRSGAEVVGSVLVDF